MSKYSTMRQAKLTIAVSSALAFSATQAAVITVDTLDDPGAPGNCSLRSAIESINSGASVNNCALPDGIDDTIEFESGLQGSVTLTAGQLQIAAPMNIFGPGAGELTIDGDGNSRVIEIDNASASISGVTITGGNAKYGGGGIYVNSSADLLLSDCVISGNTAGFEGGGIAVYGGLQVDDCEISQNTSTSGAGISVKYGADVALSACAITGNTAEFRGGGIHVDEGDLGVDDCEISGNAVTGIGSSGTVGNYLDNRGGGGYGVGGGIAVTSGEAVVRNSTVSGNMVSGIGGGLWVMSQYSYYGPGPVMFPQQSGSDRGGIYADLKLTVEDSIVSGNTANVGGGIGAGVLDNGSYYYALKPRFDENLGDQLPQRSTSLAPSPDGLGGAGPNLVVSGSVITDNMAYYGGGIGALGGSSVYYNGPELAGGGYGGAIYTNRIEIGDESVISDNQALIMGGGLLSKYGSTYLFDSSVADNNSGYAGGGIANLGSYGAGPLDTGVMGLGSGGALIVANSSISGNEVLGSGPRGGGFYFGGGIVNALGLTYLYESEVSGNSTPEIGGGLATLGGASILVASQISGNSGGGSLSGFGSYFIAMHSRIEDNLNGPVGGIACEYNNCLVKYSSVTGNEGEMVGGLGADLNLLGGGPRSWAQRTALPQGGGYAYLNVGSSTFSGNSGGYAGAILAPALELAHSTIGFNEQNANLVTGGLRGGLPTAGGIATLGDYSSIDHSIIANNSADTGSDNLQASNNIEMNFSLIGDDQGFTPVGTGNILNQDPLLGPLDFNGGSFSLTHALLTGSPAIDAGDPGFSGPPNNDQRGPGFARVFNNVIDIGAFELVVDGIFHDRFEMQ